MIMMSFISVGLTGHVPLVFPFNGGQVSRNSCRSNWRGLTTLTAMKRSS